MPGAGQKVQPQGLPNVLVLAFGKIHCVAPGMEDSSATHALPRLLPGRPAYAGISGAVHTIRRRKGVFSPWTTYVTMPVFMGLVLAWKPAVCAFSDGGGPPRSTMDHQNSEPWTTPPPLIQQASRCIGPSRAFSIQKGKKGIRGGDTLASLVRSAWPTPPASAPLPPPRAALGALTAHVWHRPRSAPPVPPMLAPTGCPDTAAGMCPPWRASKDRCKMKRESAGPEAPADKGAWPAEMGR